jgi:hypothetical protein
MHDLLKANKALTLEAPQRQVYQMVLVESMKDID